MKKTTGLPKELLDGSVFFILIGVLQAEAYQIINCCGNERRSTHTFFFANVILLLFYEVSRLWLGDQMFMLSNTVNELMEVTNEIFTTD
jgi:hypothetical protein